MELGFGWAGFGGLSFALSSSHFLSSYLLLEKAELYLAKK
jgi:hypothetical protein